MGLIIYNLTLLDLKMQLSVYPNPPPDLPCSQDGLIKKTFLELSSSDEYLYYDVEYPVEDPDLSGEVSMTWFKILN